MKKGTILPLNVNPGYLPNLFVESLAHSYKALPHLLPIRASTSALPNRARTMNGYAFLDSEAEWALLLDSDMAWTPEAILRLTKTAKETGARAVSGFTFMQHQGRIVPHAYQRIAHELHPEGKVTLPYAVLPSFTEPFKVAAVGGACFLVHREVYETVLKQRKQTAYPWQEEVYMPHEDAMQGEDLVFSRRIGDAGFDIIYEPRAPFIHMDKPQPITLERYVDFLERSGIEHPFETL